MTEPDPDVQQIVSSAPIVRWSGNLWRFHRRAYAALDTTGAQLRSGRYHRGLDLYPSEQVMPSLYLALSPEVALGEVLRNTGADRLATLNDYFLSQVECVLHEVMDLRSAVRRSELQAVLCHPTARTVSRAVGAAAYVRGVEGMLVPSCSRLGDNLIAFPEQLSPRSSLVIIDRVNPELYIERR